MKIQKVFILQASLVVLVSTAGAQTAPPQPPDNPAEAQQPAEPARPEQKVEPPTKPPEQSAPEADGKLRLNFRGVPLETVLNYLSDAAGFIIILDTEVRGKVDVWSNQPLTKDEAVDLLNTILNKNGYTAIRNGRTLTVVNRDDAKKRDIPVRSGSDPDSIDKTDEMVTQIIPVRYANATQLTKDLQPLLPSYAMLTANESGNALVLTDTQANVRRMVEIVKALDTSISGVATIRVFHLKNADPTEMANVLATLFPDDGRGGDQSAGFRFARGPMAGLFGGGAPSADASSNDRMKKQGRVIAVPDPRTSSVIVTAASELMVQIEAMIEQLDASPAKKQKVFVYALENADAQQVEQVLQEMFQRTSTPTNRTSSGQNPLNTRSTTNQGTRSGTGFGTTRSGGTGVGGR